MSTKFELSQSEGAHSLLPRLTGEWAGSARLWFERDELVEENKVRSSTSLILFGRFLRIEYHTRTQEFETDGLGIYGFDLHLGQWTGAWVDNYHNGTSIMNSVNDGKEVPDGFSVLGRYPDGQGGYWGWRSELRLAGPDNLIYAHFNIPPGEPEYIAVEYAMGRV
ncbi:DUF1579 family protein [bacterium]|nr:DUF1579 family protein [bacterium]